MLQQAHQKAMGDAKNNLKNDLVDIPTACQYGNLCSNDTHRIHNENVNWLVEPNDKLLIWSRLKLNNCAGQPRQMMFSQDTDYEIEVPGRLLSIFGNTQQQTNLINKMKSMENHQLVANVMALCSALRYNFRQWSSNLLDAIMSKSIELYPKLLQKLNINDKEITICNLNQLYQFADDNFQVQLQQVATGYLYIRYGLNEFNLARALTWFFRNYQFGLLQCNNRTLAFGFTLDSDYSFFMYDCQTRGHPLFQDQQANSYILRTHHLQILLYCLIMTLNVSKEMNKFCLYNVDIRILNPVETRTLKKEIYVPTIAGLPKKEVEKKVDCGTIHKKINTKQIDNKKNKGYKSANTSTVNLTTKNNLKSSKSSTPNLVKKSNINSKTMASKSEMLKTQNSHTKISLDPNKTYYIIAVPKKSNVAITKSESKQSSCTKNESHAKYEKTIQENLKNVKVNIHRIHYLSNGNSDEDSKTETLHLNKTPSTATLTQGSVDTCSTNNANNLGLKVYLVDNRNNSAVLKSSHQIK